MQASMRQSSLSIANSAMGFNSMDRTHGVMRSTLHRMRSDTNRRTQQTRPLIAEIPTSTCGKISSSPARGSRHFWEAGIAGLGKQSGGGRLVGFLANTPDFHFPR